MSEGTPIDALSKSYRVRRETNTSSIGKGRPKAQKRQVPYESAAQDADAKKQKSNLSVGDWIEVFGVWDEKRRKDLNFSQGALVRFFSNRPERQLH